MGDNQFQIPQEVVDAAKLAGAPSAAEWLASASPELLKKLWLTDLVSVLLGSGAPVEVLLASWPRSERRDEVVKSLIGELAQSSCDISVCWFEGAASWLDIRPLHPDSIELARHTHLGAFSYGHADALATKAHALPFQFEPNPTSWTDTGKLDKYYVPGKYVPGGRNAPPHYQLDDVLANGVAGVVVQDVHLPALITAANARGCSATVLGPLEAMPAKVISWDGQGYGMNLTILQSAKTGFWIFREDVH